MARRKQAVPHIPILGWYSIPPGKDATLEHYREMREAGFDYSFSHIYKYEDAIRALDLCAEVGMKSVFMCPELKKEPEETVRRVMKHPGLGMYFLRDEPKNDDMEELGTWARRIKSVDDKHPCYLNLLPIGAYYTPDNTYENHLHLFNEKVDLPQISFDHYPISEKDGVVSLSSIWYENLEVVSAEARRVGKPFWAFALSSAHWSFPIPTIEHLRLQMYSNLAYGAQLLQYFTYWKPGGDNHISAPIMLDGRRTGDYELVRQMNLEIQQRAFVWAGCTVKSVCHIGDKIPVGTRPLTTIPAHFRTLQNEQGSGLVSEIQNGGRNFVMLVNTSPTGEWHVRIETDNQVQLIRRDGTSAPAWLYDSLFILSPGDCAIFEQTRGPKSH
ncbi:MAG: hypothetical protein IJR87_04850 [Bacteroidaceae bacterium]|nr:hypothetical protein [Bacteroidaceae bacterium]